jgi:hypothetical protein
MQLNPADPKFIIGLVVILAIILVAVVIYVSNRRKTKANLKQRFGTEYDRAVLQHGSESKAEAALESREARVEHLNIRELTTPERERYVADWQLVQSRFVDHPKGAVIEADELVASLMNARGYPVADFEQRAADVSVNHPRVVDYYRSAHDVALRLGRDEATTEDMRNAMIQYRTLFDELLHIATPVATQAVA